MKIIEQTTEHLPKDVVNTCPACQWPDFECVESRPGLPYGYGREALRLSLVKIYQCKNCNYSDERYYTEGAKLSECIVTKVTLTK